MSVPENHTPKEAVTGQEIEAPVDTVAERKNRIEKLAAFKAAGIHPYPARFEKTIDLAQARSLTEGATVCTAGRIVLFRQMGSITFAHIQDFTGRIQIVFKKDTVGADLQVDHQKSRSRRPRRRRGGDLHDQNGRDLHFG